MSTGASIERNIALLPEPGFLALSANLASWRHIYETKIERKPVYSERAFIAGLPKVWAYFARHGEGESIPVRNQVYEEYEYLTSALEKAVGKRNIRLMETKLNNDVTPIDNLDMQAILDIARKNGTYANEQYRTHFKALKFTGGFAHGTSFARDLFTHVDGGAFVTPGYFPELVETPQYKKSILGEGGMVLFSGDKVMIAGQFEGDIRLEAEKRRLAALGYTVGTIPNVDKSKQPRAKRNFVDGHIDGHSNLVTDRKGHQHLFIGSSFLRQDSQTYRAVTQSTRQSGVELAEVDDKDLPLLAFNFLELPNGAVVYNPTGEIVRGNYRMSTLDQALDRIVGFDRMILMGRIRLIPRETKGGPRCLANITSEAFLQHLTTP